MRIVTLGHTPGSSVDRDLAKVALDDPAWVLLYAVHDAPIDAIVAALGARHPGVPIFGATSFQGVFSPAGFGRGAVLLVGERKDEISAHVALREATGDNAADAASEACREIQETLRRRPAALLMHATPGFEERILEGVAREFGTQVPVYGGSAADDSISGNWRVFSNERSARSGFVLVGIASSSPILGGFLGGFLPAGPTGTVTRARGRTIQTIDGRPAARVYNEWTQGAIAAELASGGNVLMKTNLLPLGRAVDERFGMPRRVLSHPHEVNAADESLALFSDFAEGDRVALMTSLRDPLISRVRRAVQRAKGNSRNPSRGGLLVYCGGSLGVLLDQADRIAAEFREAAGDIPFIGIATFGEQGCFFERSESRHGNLMCSVLLFE